MDPITNAIVWTAEVLKSVNNIGLCLPNVT